MAREVAAVAELRRELGERLATFRSAAGLTQAELAASVFCDRSRVSHLENGRGAADEAFWATVDGLLRADGLLVKAERELRAMQRDVEVRARDVEVAAALGRIDTWRQADRGDVDASRGAVTDLDRAMTWLDERAGWRPGTSRGQMNDLRAARPTLGGRARQFAERGAVAGALANYYAPGDGGTGLFAVNAAHTSVLSRTEWVGLGCELTAANERMTLRANFPASPAIEGPAATAAVHRLAEIAANPIRATDVPLYRMLDVSPSRGSIAAKFAVDSFIEYALTLDLLEGELLRAVASGRPVRRGALRLRDAYLPDLSSVLDVGGRMCAGGALALCAIARPADPNRGPADYLVLVQRRSSSVLNAGGTLAVIPKGFHSPLADYRADVRIGATLLRELEEELFGRIDVDSTEGPQRAADPMHPTRLSEPMRWLTAEPDRMRMECTGFGLNLVSGNYEFASLIVIDDEEFWPRFGGAVNANWETDGLRQYSTLDDEMLAELVTDESWSNEGLFAFVLGLSRLREIGGARVDLPSISWAVR